MKSLKKNWPKIRGELELGKALGYVVGNDDVLKFDSILYILDMHDLRKVVMMEGHHIA